MRSSDSDRHTDSWDTKILARVHLGPTRDTDRPMVVNVHVGLDLACLAVASERRRASGRSQPLGSLRPDARSGPTCALSKYDSFAADFLEQGI